MKLPPLMRYPGGQSREARRLEKFFPEHDTYVEPFVGGGSFFFYKEPAETEVIGDTSDWVIDFYQKTRLGGLRKCRNGIRVSKGAFENSKGKKNACSRMLLQVGSWGGNGESFNPKVWATRRIAYKKKFKKLGEYEKRLRHAHLSTRSFEKTMRKFDSPTTWHLLDPPWPGAETTKSYDGGLTVEPEKVAEVCRKMKGTVWVLYNETDRIKDAFSDFYQYRISTTVYRPGGGGSNRDYRKLLLTNEPIDGKPVGVRQLQDIDGLENLGMSTSMVHVLGSVLAMGTIVAIRRLGGNGDRTTKQMIGDVLVGSSTIWLFSQIATSALRGL